MPAPQFAAKEDVKAWLGITDADEDALLDGLCTNYTSLMQKFMGRDIFQNTYSEAYSGQDTKRIALRQFPVTAVSAMTINDQPVTAAPSTMGAGFRFDDLAVYIQSVWYGVFPRGVRNITVQYTAGFSPVPVDLKQACIEQVAYTYRSRKRIGEKSQAMNAGPATQTVSFMTDDWLLSVKAVLEANARRGVPSP